MNIFFGTEWTELTGINTIPARSGSSVHSGRAGSSPASRTKILEIVWFRGFFFSKSSEIYDFRFLENRFFAPL